MDFLRELNESLLPFEMGMHPNYHIKGPIRHPFYFVIGAPRSGTTVLTQALAHCFDFGYITNIAARFWLAPVVGIRLSREILGDRPSPGFQSELARTPSPDGIHEFGFFWMHHLGLVSPDKVRKRIKPELADNLFDSLVAINKAFDRPVVMKGIYAAYYHKTMDEMLSGNALWVNIERDPIDCCISIMKAREARGGIEKWFGWHIPERDRGDIYQLSPRWQIAHQVTYFRKFYESIADVTLDLRKLCLQPEVELKKIGDKLVRKPYPGALEFRTYQDQQERAVFRDLLSRAGMYEEDIGR